MHVLEALFAGWGDMDFNSHMKTRLSGQVGGRAHDVLCGERVSDGGVLAAQARSVVMKDEVEYQKEVGCCRRSGCAGHGGPLA